MNETAGHRLIPDVVTRDGPDVTGAGGSPRSLHTRLRARPPRAAPGGSGPRGVPTAHATAQAAPTIPGAGGQIGKTATTHMSMHMSSCRGPRVTA